MPWRFGLALQLCLQVQQCLVPELLVPESDQARVVFRLSVYGGTSRTAWAPMKHSSLGSPYGDDPATAPYWIVSEIAVRHDPNRSSSLAKQRQLCRSVCDFGLLLGGGHLWGYLGATSGPGGSGWHGTSQSRDRGVAGGALARGRLFSPQQPL